MLVNLELIGFELNFIYLNLSYWFLIINTGNTASDNKFINKRMLKRCRIVLSDG